MLCEKCQTQLATCLITTVIEGKIHQAHLCADCSEKTKQPSGRIDKTKCQYCGKPSQIIVGGTDSFGKITGIPKIIIACQRCSSQYLRFLEDHKDTVWKLESDHEKASVAHALRETLDQLMREWAKSQQ